MRWWSIRTPVISSTARIVQAAPPNWNAQLNSSNVGLILAPSGLVHCGTCAIRSRGMLTAVALLRSADRCSRIVVSERWVPVSLPYFSLPAPRLSEPISRMFSADGRALGGALRVLGLQLGLGHRVGGDVAVEPLVEVPGAAGEGEHEERGADRDHAQPAEAALGGGLTREPALGPAVGPAVEPASGPVPGPALEPAACSGSGPGPGTGSGFGPGSGRPGPGPRRGRRRKRSRPAEALLAWSRRCPSLGQWPGGSAGARWSPGDRTRMPARHSFRQSSAFFGCLGFPSHAGVDRILIPWRAVAGSAAQVP